MKFLIKYKIIISVVSYLLIIWAVFEFAVGPLIGQVSLEADKAQEDILDRENKAKRSEELPKLKGQFEMVEREEGKIKILLTKDKAIDLIKSLEILADKTGNKISIEIDEKTPAVIAKKESPIEIESTNNVGKNTSNEADINAMKSAKVPTILDELPKLNYLKLKIILLGRYNNMVNFMTKLENFDYYSDVISINIDQDEGVRNSSSRDLFGRSSSGSQSGEQTKSDLLKSELMVLFYLE
jgi:hypothetical protein